MTLGKANETIKLYIIVSPLGSLLVSLLVSILVCIYVH